MFYNDIHVARQKALAEDFKTPCNIHADVQYNNDMSDRLAFVWQRFIMMCKKDDYRTEEEIEKYVAWIAGYMKNQPGETSIIDIICLDYFWIKSQYRLYNEKAGLL